MSKQIKNTAREVFRLQSKKYLTPHFIRITLSGDVSGFKNTTIGDNNKIFIPPQGVAKVYLPELDEVTHSWIHPPQEVAPSVRTYTHRGIDLRSEEHTSELQSRENLVCRLLLEKKKLSVEL